ncbi:MULTISPECIES: cytochrome c oxidase subunit 3 [Exiguobacterium]|uniref:Cytochrome c oxidase subunit 3 n=1 Tax=Exiguobacterium alkaliphilum TaxID=1428684 RepID=A0ABT2KY54_9BACL|nr:MULTISPECIES: cytochrome c oxidase subunit 3 [Exiguobacterium]MCT4794490.1 cytochrome c oxidase subunit 3 [Exiguobacterium alkaliphilum]QUE85753.1 cytochrome c oxidase subunit 3 [Exiguobacterium alkaliphilum]
MAHAVEKHPVTGLPANPEKATLDGKNKYVAFWFFLGGETVLFASLFGTYVGLLNSGAPEELRSYNIFEMGLVFFMTMLLLTSSLTSVLAMMNMKANNPGRMKFWLIVTLVLGAGFLAAEIYEFIHYYHIGHTFTSSAFGSAFYTLVGFHGAHVTFGLFWIGTLLIRNWNRPIDVYNAPKFYVSSLYWHFIDVVWVFIFSIVYLLGMVS